MKHTSMNLIKIILNNMNTEEFSKIIQYAEFLANEDKSNDAYTIIEDIIEEYQQDVIN